MCFFFVCLSSTLWTVKNKNAYIFFNSIFPGKKVNLVGTWGGGYLMTIYIFNLKFENEYYLENKKFWKIILL